MKTILLFFLLCSSVFAYSLTWTPNPFPQSVTSYNIYRVKKGGADLMTSVASPLVTINVDAYLNSNRTKFYITAVNANGESPHSSQVTVQRH
jgi:hypothetical protein